MPPQVEKLPPRLIPPQKKTDPLPNQSPAKKAPSHPTPQKNNYLPIHLPTQKLTPSPNPNRKNEKAVYTLTIRWTDRDYFSVILSVSSSLTSPANHRQDLRDNLH